MTAAVVEVDASFIPEALRDNPGIVHIAEAHRCRFEIAHFVNHYCQIFEPPRRATRPAPGSPSASGRRRSRP